MMEICGHEVNVGDYIEAQYTTKIFKGRIIQGHITGLWDENSPDIEVINPEGFKQAQLDHFWCFHNRDAIILKHERREGR